MLEEYKGRLSGAFQIEPIHRELFLKDARFYVTPYAGRYGWVSLDVGARVNWSEVKELVAGSHRLATAKAAQRPAAAVVSAGWNREERRGTAAAAQEEEGAAMARVAGLTKEQVSGEIGRIFERQAQRYGAPLYNHRVLARRPGIFHGFRAMWDGLEEDARLDARLRDLLNVKVASLIGCGL